MIFQLTNALLKFLTFVTGDFFKYLDPDPSSEYRSSRPLNTEVLLVKIYFSEVRYRELLFLIFNPPSMVRVWLYFRILVCYTASDIDHTGLQNSIRNIKENLTYRYVLIAKCCCFHLTS